MREAIGTRWVRRSPTRRNPSSAPAPVASSCAPTPCTRSRTRSSRGRIPLLHIVDAAAAEIRRGGIDKVGLLGTRFTMEDDFYRGAARAPRHRGDRPPKADRETVHRVIFEELCRARCSRFRAACGRIMRGWSTPARGGRARVHRTRDARRAGRCAGSRLRHDGPACANGGRMVARGRPRVGRRGPVELASTYLPTAGANHVESEEGPVRLLAYRGDSLRAGVERITATLKEQGFGILTEIDVKATLKKKIDKDFTKYVILGACNPASRSRRSPARSTSGCCCLQRHRLRESRGRLDRVSCSTGNDGHPHRPRRHRAAGPPGTRKGRRRPRGDVAVSDTVPDTVSDTVSGRRSGRRRRCREGSRRAG